MTDADILEFQLSCDVTEPSLCDKCAFFMGCERKYNIKNFNKEYFTLLKESIVIFPSLENWEEFAYHYGLNESDLKTALYNDIIDLSNKLTAEIIIYN